jgi:hypothetical protein
LALRTRRSHVRVVLGAPFDSPSSRLRVEGSLMASHPQVASNANPSKRSA